jgi:hypothetical protein
VKFIGLCCSGHVAKTEDTRNAYSIPPGSFLGKRLLEDLNMMGELKLRRSRKEVLRTEMME